MKSLYTKSDVCGVVVALLLVAAATACSSQQKPELPAATPAAAEAPIPATASPYDVLPESVRAAMDKPHTDDFDAMIKRRAIRVGVTFNRRTTSSTGGRSAGSPTRP